MILYFAADLIWASKIKLTADSLQIPARPVRSIEMLEARLSDTQPVALLVDLDKPEVALQLLNHLRRPEATPEQRRIQVVAWGPHVDVDSLEAARTMGANRVMTRGAFDSQMSEIMRSLCPRPPIQE